MKNKQNNLVVNRIAVVIARVQKVLDKELLHSLGSPKMSALTSCKGLCTICTREGGFAQKEI